VLRRILEMERNLHREEAAMTITSQPSVAAHSSDHLRRAIRFGAAALCGLTGVLYLLLFFLVREAEVGLSENTFGAYLFLAIPYLVGAGLMLAYDLRLIWGIGAAVQVVVLVLFAMFGAGLWGPGQGVFDYAALDGLHMALWAGVIATAEVILLALFGYLTFSAPTADAGRHEQS
jgi:hypothetical protein